MVVKVSYNITTPTIRVTYSDNSVYVKATQASSSIYIKVGYGIDHVNWGDIGGTLSDQVDLQSALDAKVDDTTTITINGTTQDLSANRTWNVGDMLKSVYDTDNSGIVDKAEKMTTICRNSTGSTIYKGTIVYLHGSTGNRPNILKAIATSDATSAQTFGVVIADIANNSDGEVATLGTLDDLDTRSSATHPFTNDTLADGDILYLSPTTPGYVTNVKPYAPYHIVYCGMVVRTHPTLGTIVYRIQNGYEITELHDVSAQTPSNNDGLFYESATSLWKNKSIATVLGYTPSDSSLVVPTSRTLTINGTTYDLSANRTWTISGSNIYSADGTLTGNRTLTSGGYNLTFTGTNVASGAIARGILMNHTLTAAANNDVLVGLDINPTFSTGAFTGVKQYGVRLNGSSHLINNTPTIEGTVIWGYNIYFNGSIYVNNGVRGNNNSDLIFGNTAGTNYAKLFNSTGNFALQNGGTFTDNGARLQVTGTGYFSDSVGIGTTSLTGYSLRITKSITGAANSYGLVNDSVIESDVTSSATIFRSQPTTRNTSFTLGSLIHFYVNPSSFGAGSSVTSQYGYYVESALTGATNNYGFYGNIAAGTGRWNLYMNGTADNYLAGSLGIGTTSLTGYNVHVTKSITGAINSSGMMIDSPVQSDVTSIAYYYNSYGNTQNTAFTLGNLIHYYANANTTFGSATVTSQTGFYAANGLTGATNNYGFFGNIPSGTNRWNLYMNGTANNYMAGKLLVGTTTDAASAIVNIASTTQGFLMPRMTTAQRDLIATPATGLSIYNTTLNTKDYYNGTSWVSLAAGNIYTTDGTLTGNRTVTSGGYNLTFTGSNTASASLAKGIGITHTLVAAANNDVLVGLDINPTFTNGAFTTTRNIGIRVQSGRVVIGSTSLDTSSYPPSLLVASNSTLFATTPSHGGLWVTESNSANFAHIGFYSNGVPAFKIGRTGTTYSGMADKSFLHSSSDLWFTTSNSSYPDGANAAAVLFTATKNITIGGTTDAGYKLDVQGTGRFTGDLAITSISGNSIASSASAYVFNVTTSAGYRLFKLQNDGKSGIFADGSINFGQQTINTTTHWAWGVGYSYIAGGNNLSDKMYFAASDGGNVIRYMAADGANGLKVEINPTTTFVSSALLTVNSTTRGFLPPRMTNAQRTAIASPSVGLMVYCTDAVEGLYVYKSTGWTFVI